jgi:hypothetical protein
MSQITRDTHPPANAVTVVEADEAEAEELPPTAAAIDEATGRYIEPGAALKD